MKNIADLRQDYHQSQLLESDVLPDATDQFQLWLDQAVAAEILEPNIMTLATVGAQGQPSARIVLLKGIEEGDFLFYTNYQSTKGHDIQDNPKVALMFFWQAIERQVCVHGRATKVDRATSEAYFHSRPTGSQLGAWASRQSQVVASREVLDERMNALEKQYEGQTIPLPEFWGGYRVEPTRVEFWQGRTGRLHDRLRYTRVAPASTATAENASDRQWRIERVCP